MQNSDNIIYFNFSYFALRLLGKGLYNNGWSAISELVANGLDARATNVKLYFNMKDKQHSTVEIFDNGHGMGYKELSEKYALIGKNKRDDDQIDEDLKEQFMGRKGIGKLSALYLSNKYYLISKTNNEKSAWCLDASNAKDSDIPHLDRVNANEIFIESNEYWNTFKTGTMIKLTNVDLTNIGEKTIDAFKARLADFYLLDDLKGRIELAVLMGCNDKVEFEEVRKSIAFKNLFAFYNNTDNDFSKLLAETVFVPARIDIVKNKPRKVEILDNNNFSVKGKKKFLKPDGSLSNELEYEMKGWIGIHSSIKIVEAIINDSEYQRNKAYRPNQLRLYVRKKLAVENFLDYIGNTQAFSNYIEGEISFDILDANELGDITTSNRQDLIKDDERVIQLIDILKPIINQLIRKRILISNIIRAEEDAYYNDIREKLEKEKVAEELKRKESENARQLAEKERELAYKAKVEAEKARMLAEDERKKADNEKLEAEKAKALAEIERERANEAKKEAEKSVIALNNELKSVNTDLGSEKKRNYFLVDVLSQDQIEFTKRLHMVKINVDTIDKIVTKLVMKIQRNRFTVEDAWDSLKTISYSTGRIRATLHYGGVAQFDTREETITGDLFQYISEYVDNILVQNKGMKVIAAVETNVKFVKKFSMQDIAVVLENIVSNSSKYHASILNINMYKTEKEYAIDFADNGDGLNEDIKNVEGLFEFGKGYTTTGTGVGLYHIREIIEQMGGYTKINTNIQKGFELQVRYSI